jgi:hypothetical protein
MIRINLLAAERDRAKKKAVTLGTVGQKLTIGCSLILVLGGLAIGWRYWTVNHDSAELDKEIAAAQQETTRLHSVIEQVQQFEQRKAQLQQRVVLIEQLRKGQTGPGAHAGSDQPCAAADAVAHGGEADRHGHRDRRQVHVADWRVRLRRESRGVRVFQAIDRHRQHEHRGDAAAARGVDQVQYQGGFSAAGRRESAGGARGGSLKLCHV